MRHSVDCQSYNTFYTAYMSQRDYSKARTRILLDRDSLSLRESRRDRKKRLCKRRKDNEKARGEEKLRETETKMSTRGRDFLLLWNMVN